MRPAGVCSVLLKNAQQADDFLDHAYYHLRFYYMLDWDGYTKYCNEMESKEIGYAGGFTGFL